MRVTLAPATARPCGSVTIPLREDEPAWAKATLDISSTKANTLTIESSLVTEGLTLFIGPPLEDVLQKIGELIDTKIWMIDVGVLLGSEVATGVTLNAVTNVRR